MTVGVLIWLAVFGLMLVTFTATGVRVFHEFSHYELEQYCRTRNQESRFDQIVSWHEKLSLAAEAIQAFGGTLALMATSCALFQLGRIDGRIHIGQFVAAILLGTLILLVTTSWIPWAVGRQWSAPFLYHTWRIWFVCRRLAWPLTIGVGIVTAFLRRVTGHQGRAVDNDEAWEDEVRTIVKTSERDGLLETDLREMIEGVIELDKLSISEIMTPRSRVDAIDIKRPFDEIVEFVIRVGRTRIPVYDGQLENTIGVLFVKDLLPEITKSDSERVRSVRPMLREPWYVPESKAVDSMLSEFLQTKSHLAIVLDEFNNVAGVVTIEDVLEEIVGEIVDESDRDEVEGIVKIAENEYDVLAITHIDEINDQLGINLPDPEDFDTIGGLVLSQLGEVPKAGRMVTLDGVRIEVIDADRRSIHQVRVNLIDRPLDRSSESDHKDSPPETENAALG